VIQINNFTKKYKNNTVFENVSFAILDHQITFLMGENGSGKTTLVKSILNLEKYQGQILFDDNPITCAYGDISAVYDDSPLYLCLNGYQNIRLLCNRSISNNETNAFALQLLSEPELRKKVKKYSYGQRKKLSIIIAFLNESKYIFMDEVSNGLDYDTMNKVKEMLKEHVKTKSIFLTGHQFEFYNDIVNSILIVKNKNIVSYENDNKSLEWIYKNEIENN
jgi:ABC-type multidrug transport system ATPase subunit